MTEIKASGITLIRAHLCLYHQRFLGAHVPHKLVHIQVASLFHAFQHGVQCDIGACPAHTSTTVHQDGPVTGVIVAHTSNKFNEGGSKLGNTVIRPAQEMELSNRARDFTAALRHLVTWRQGGGVYRGGGGGGISQHHHNTHKPLQTHSTCNK